MTITDVAWLRSAERGQVVDPTEETNSPVEFITKVKWSRWSSDDEKGGCRSHLRHQRIALTGENRRRQKSLCCPVEKRLSAHPHLGIRGPPCHLIRTAVGVLASDAPDVQAVGRSDRLHSHRMTSGTGLPLLCCQHLQARSIPLFFALRFWPGIQPGPSPFSPAASPG